MAKEGLHLNLYRVSPGVWRCDIKLNTSKHGEGITWRGTSEGQPNPATVMGSWLSKLSHPLQALSKARVLAQAVVSNPAFAQAFPQYAIPAMLALQAMEKADHQGKLGVVKKQLTDATLKKVARELHEMSNGQRTAMSGGGVCLACDSSMRGAPTSFNYLAGSGARTQQERGAPGDVARGPFGLPSGNPHPFAQHIKQQLVRGGFRDPITLQKLARMMAYQRGMARASR